MTVDGETYGDKETHDFVDKLPTADEYWFSYEDMMQDSDNEEEEDPRADDA